MISATAEKGFLAAHWDWLVAGAGILALAGAGVFMAMEFGVDPSERADEERAGLAGGNRTDTGVEAVDMAPYGVALKELATPSRIVEPAEKDRSFLASERRIFCEQGEDAEHKSCGMPIPADLKVCPFCQTKQPEEKKVALDSDGDGLPDDWETANGTNPNMADADADTDGDGFTNMEEYLAGTSPADPSSHPDYLDSLKVSLPLKTTVLPFYFESVSKIPSGWRFFFKDPKKRNDYGKLGKVYSVVAGEAIGDTGYIVKSYEQKSVKQAIKGGKGMEKTVDVSEAEIVRKADGRPVRLVVGEKNKPIDIQATLVYDRLGTQEFAVVAGSEIALNGVKYKVLEIKQEPQNGARVTLKNLETGKAKSIVALEQ